MEIKVILIIVETRAKERWATKVYLKLDHVQQFDSGKEQNRSKRKKKRKKN